MRDCVSPISDAATATTSPLTSQQRRKHGPGEENVPLRQGKRGKYTSVACEECKKRKSKCIPAGDAGCERCIDGGVVCVYSRAPSQLGKEKGDRQNFDALSNEVAQLRQQLVDLTGAVTRLGQERIPSHILHPLSPASQGVTLIQSPASNVHTDGVPKEPRFIGPTRPAFGLVIGERALNRMGIPVCDSLPASGAQSPAHSSHAPTRTLSPGEFWLHCTLDEVSRLLGVWHDEVESVYPFIDLREQMSQAPQLLDCIRSGESFASSETGVDARDIDFVKVALATAMVFESGGKNELSTAIVDSVERNISRIATPNVDLKSVQLLVMLSIYFFHCDEELLSWRTIGVAAREALEMGLHRKESVFDHFKDRETRRRATRVFWCMYVLDRRWSFGTGLSFAVVDRDIDPELPEPDAEYAYLRCMVRYGRLCTKIWEAIPPFGSSPQSIPEDVVRTLEASALAWLESIPLHLQLRHPRLGLAPRSQPSNLHRLRAFLYLRGNHARCLIHRHYVLDGPSISRNLQGAWLVVDIAMDSIQVLVHLSATTDIYKRQQNAFNYFLLSALAVVVLAVCNAPEIFTGPCRKSFLDAVELVRGFSRDSNVSMRLWKTIRGLLPRLRALGLQRSEEGASSVERTPTIPVTPRRDNMGIQEDFDGTQDMDPTVTTHVTGVDLNGELITGADVTGSMPDIFQMGTDLVSLFDAFGQGYSQPQDEYHDHSYNLPGDFDCMVEMGGEISRRFQGLI